MLPMAFWQLLFFLSLPVAFYFAVFKEPIYAACVAAYLYFAIPPLEFNAPSMPYAAAFWAIAVVTSIRYRKMLRDSARKEIIDAGQGVAKEAIDSVREELVNAVVLAAVQDRKPGELRMAAMIAAEAKAIELAESRAPKDIAVPVRKAVRSTLELGADLAEREALKIVDNMGRTTKGNLKSALEARVPPIVFDALDKQIVELTKQEVNRTIDERDKKESDRSPVLGALNIPLPRGPLTGALSNPGLWLHMIFTVLTYFGAQEAMFNVYKAMVKFDTCVLLFIPIVAIICAVRDPRHVRLFIFAWMIGTLHLSLNAVTWWLQNGGRADNPGGQGGESNFLGGIIVTIAPVSFGLILNSKKWLTRGGSVLLAAIFTLGILASGSRAALIAFIASSGYWLLYTNKKGLAAGGAMIAGACFLVMAPDDFWDRMGTIFAAKDKNPWVHNEVEPSKHERQVLWALAIEVYQDHPWTGIGPGQYNYISAERTEFTDPYQNQRGLQTHNTWLQLAAEYGTIGTAVWALAFLLSGFCYWLARRKIRKYAGWEWFAALCLGMEAGTLGNAIACTFNSFQWYDYHYWHFIFGPLCYVVAKETAERLEWMKPIDRFEPHPPPRYGPPVAEGLDLASVDLSSFAPVAARERRI